MTVAPTRMWRVAALTIGLVLVAYFGASLWKASRAVRESFDWAASGERLQFTSSALDRPIPNGFEWIGTPALYTDVQEFRGHLFLCGPSGLFEHEPNGALQATYRVGLELPPSLPLKMATGTTGDSGEPELFVATADAGLLAFDGRAFRHICPSEPPYRKLTAILPLASGRLLLGTEKRGVLVYDGKRLMPFHPSLSGLQVTALAGSESNLWVGTLDRGVYHWYAGQVDRFDEAAGLPDHQVLSIAVTEGAAYVGTPTGVAEFREGRFHRSLASGFFARALLAHDAQLLVGTLDEGMLDVPLAAKAPRTTRPVTQPFSGRVERLLEISGETCALAEDGLYSVDARSGDWRRVVACKGGLLTDRNISALDIDEAGKVWVGFFDRGLDIVEPGGERATHFEDDHVFCVNRITHSPTGDLTAVGTANGLAMFDTAGRLRQVLGKSEGLIADQVTDVMLLAGRITVATPAGLTFIDAGGTRSLYAFHGLVNNHVYALAGSGERLLAGTLGGLSILEAGQVRASFNTTNSALKNNWVTAILAVGEEWFVGTHGSGLLRLDPAGDWQSFPDATASFEVNPNAMAATRSHVYAGTLARGLYVYDRAALRWTAMTVGLPSMNVTAVATDGKYVYLGTDNGLVRFREESLTVR